MRSQVLAGMACQCCSVVGCFKMSMVQGEHRWCLIYMVHVDDDYICVTQNGEGGFGERNKTLAVHMSFSRPTTYDFVIQEYTSYNNTQGSDL